MPNSWFKFEPEFCVPGPTLPFFLPHISSPDIEESQNEHKFGVFLTVHKFGFLILKNITSASNPLSIRDQGSFLAKSKDEMEILMGSCWKSFPPKYGETDRLIWKLGDVSLKRKENGFLRNQKRDLRLGFSLSVSFHCKTAVRSASSATPENQTLVESKETDQIPVSDQPRTAHVRFKLTKQCAFGQHFVVVGDDPCLGLWDPSDGVRFDWSDGHLWTADLDVPCGKAIKYKFIMKVDDNNILWQSGPDRILETWETEKTIVVVEDWDHPEFRDIIEEEEFIADLNDEKSLINSELLTLSQNLSQTTQDEGTDAKKQPLGTNEHLSLDDKVKQDSNTCINYSKHEESLVLEQEAPVLLPGMIPLSTDETDEESPNEVKDMENVPCGKEIAHKVILKVDDNTLETWETEKPIPVFEDWDNPEFHDVVQEEEFIADLNDEKSLINSELQTVSENLGQTTHDEGTEAKKQPLGTNDHSSLDDTVKQDSKSCINYSKHEESSVLEREAPVLSPGLIPMSTDETDDKYNEVKDSELKEEHNSASLRSTETSKVVMESKKGFYGKEQLQILVDDKQWGRGMFQKFLAMFGF